MGTVGLNFGNPTGGSGFDVSSTVAQIVGNLRNVETPWKDQLTKLTTQDTTISSLGTLFSNLSNSISSLTDLQGIMAQKEGSSSDQNVLTLTAANSSAIAGTHTIQVANLAQTSSGYLAEMTNASDALSGSVTLQVGSGTAQTITLDSTNNTLSGLATAINASSSGVIASVLTDSSGSRLSLVSGTSGASGKITVSNNSIADIVQKQLLYTGTVGTATTKATAALGSITNASDVLSGSFSIQLGSGTAENVVIGAAPSSPAANTIYTGNGVNTLAGIADAITQAGIGVSASATINSDGTSSLSMVSDTTGAVALNVNSQLIDKTPILNYTPTVTGKDASLTVDGITMTSASNTVANLIPGVTFQLLAPSANESDGSLEQVQVVIANDNAGVESTIAGMVSSYNAAISGINTQEGYNSSGVAEPLFGSPTISLLQQQLLGSLNTQNPNGFLDSIPSTDGTTLSGSMTIEMGGGVTRTVVIGAAPSTADGGPAANTIYTGSGSNYNTIEGVAAAINAADTAPLSFNDTGNTSTGNYDSGTLGSLANSGNALTGTLTIAAGGGATKTIVIGAAPSSGAASNTIYTGTGAGYNTIAGVISAINAADVAPLAYTDGGYSGTGNYSNGTLGPVAFSDESLGGSMTIAVGAGTTVTVVIGAAPSASDGGPAANTIYTGSGSGYNTLAGVAKAITTSNIGATASAVTNGDGTVSLFLESKTSDAAGALAVSSNITASIGVTASPVTNSDGTSSISLVSSTAGTAGKLALTSYITGSLGVNAGVSTVSGESNLTLASQTTGSSGALTVKSSFIASSPTALTYTDQNNYTSTTPDTGTVGSVASTTDILTGSIKISVGNGATHTITLDSSNHTLYGLQSAIEAAGLGITASVISNNDGSYSLSLQSPQNGSSGALTVTSSLFNTTNPPTKTVNYNNSSDVGSLTGLGISLNNDGTMTLDATSLDSLLNSDYSGIVGFFQNATSWGQNFSTIVTNSGSSSSTGILSLAAKSNSNIESTLNADISKEELLISAQQKSLTAELNSANEIMQELPSQLQSVNELYSAITGYNQSTNG
jgi:flagellar hook-associated protein 2